MGRTVVVTGASGFMGREIVRRLEHDDWSVIALSTDPERAKKGAPGGTRQWLELGSDEATRAIQRAGKVVNLAGAHPFERRWNDAYKRSIYDSRVRTTEWVVSALAKASADERVLVNASGAGFYGNCGDNVVTEEQPRGRSWFLSDMIGDWEDAADKASSAGVRVARMRIGLALERDGGALPIMEGGFRKHMGGHVGTGRQFVPWIHNRDAAAMFVSALESAAWSGCFNCAAPAPVRFAELAQAIGTALGRRSWFHAPPLAARLMIGEASAILLESQRLSPTRATALGFRFEFASLDRAFAAIYSTERQRAEARDAS